MKPIYEQAKAADDSVFFMKQVRKVLNGSEIVEKNVSENLECLWNIRSLPFPR